MTFWLVLLFLVTSQLEAADCPEGSVAVVDENTCLFYSNKAKSYTDVTKHCKGLGGYPVQIKNIYENAYVNLLASNGSDPYIGVERASNNSYHYPDGTPLGYSMWEQGEPAIHSTYTCATMSSVTGKWKTSTCSSAKPFLCSITLKDETLCPTDWVYNNKTGFCYYLQDYYEYNQGTYTTYNMYQAESNCRLLDAHLASIHSKDEDSFVQNLIRAPSPFDGSACSGSSVWIGLINTGQLRKGNWTDGTTVNYINGDVIGAYYFWGLSDYCDDPVPAKWDALEIADYQFPRYLCKKKANKSS